MHIPVYSGSAGVGSGIPHGSSYVEPSYSEIVPGAGKVERDNLDSRATPPLAC